MAKHRKDHRRTPLTAQQQATLVLGILAGEVSIQKAARKHGVTVAELEDWKRRFLVAAAAAFARPPGSEPIGASEEQPSTPPRPSSPRPEPYLPEAFFSPEERADAVAEILLAGVRRVNAEKRREKSRRYRRRKTTADPPDRGGGNPEAPKKK